MLDAMSCDCHRQPASMYLVLIFMLVAASLPFRPHPNNYSTALPFAFTELCVLFLLLRSFLLLPLLRFSLLLLPLLLLLLLLLPPLLLLLLLLLLTVCRETGASLPTRPEYKKGDYTVPATTTHNTKG